MSQHTHLRARTHAHTHTRARAHTLRRAAAQLTALPDSIGFLQQLTFIIAIGAALLQVPRRSRISMHAYARHRRIRGGPFQAPVMQAVFQSFYAVWAIIYNYRASCVASCSSPLFVSTSVCLFVQLPDSIGDCQNLEVRGNI